MDEVTEQEILKRIRSGEIDAYALLVIKYSPIIYFYVTKKIERKEDCEDITQDTFIKAYKGLDQFNISKRFYPYLFTICKHVIADFYRSHKPTHQLIEETYITVEAHEEEIAVSSLLEHLNPDQKTVLQLYYLEGYSYKEIAEKLNKPLNTIKTLLSRAKERAQRVYEGKNSKK